MILLSPRSSILPALVSLVSAVTFSTPAVAATPPARTQVFDSTDLRGYGPVSGVLRVAEGDGGSVLEITCADEARAKLTHAKYLSDLALTGGVREVGIKAGRVSLSAHEIAGQGWIAALRSSARVFIVAAPDRTALERLVSRHTPRSAVSRPEVEVPMWLDRWDRFGFRFYYRPWETPEGKTRSTYDFAKEFEFAEKNDRSGFLFWVNASEIDTAPGKTSEVWNDWAFDAAEKHKLPVGLNIMTGGRGGSWFFNRHRDQTGQHMPAFSGNFHKIGDPSLGANGHLSWNATTAKDAELGALRDIVRRAVARPNVTSVLEPHGELRHGAHDIFLEYGPAADSGYRSYLKTKYKTLADLNAARGENHSAWEGVRVPEVASFLGWGPRALDLAGDWRVAYETRTDKLPVLNSKAVATEGTPPAWLEAGFDDSAWPIVRGPGDDRAMHIPRGPAVWRRTVDVPSGWLAENKRVWLYVWDLNLATRDVFKAAVNGRVVAEETLPHFEPHWTAIEVTGTLRAGANQISLRLPKGFLGYRVYLSPEEPLQYPRLGLHQNTRWVDFIDWVGWSRVETARRGMEMIRSVTPDHPITLMAPDAYADGLRRLAVKYGGNFHNTGYMGAFWADYLPSLMRGSRLPFSLEPGGPAKTLEAFKKQLGLYATEGLQGIDYFIHIGAIMWPDDLRAHFEKNLPAIKLLGKYHAPEAQVAALYSNGSTNRTGYPWVKDYNSNLPSGYWNWNVRAYLRDRYESDGLTESSFADGDAARYPVVIDTNTSIMDDDLLAGIERYVRDGGTFVTFAQTGRHTPVEPDAWPIARLTGYRVTAIDPLDDKDRPLKHRNLLPAPGQTMFSGTWNRVDMRANGLTLEKVAPDAQDLMLWADGGVAVGIRKLGKGAIIQVGAKFTGAKLSDRIEPRSSANRPNYDSRPAETRATIELLSQILDSLGVSRRQGAWLPENDYVLLRHFETNNGLYDVWTVWNQSVTETVQGGVRLDGRPGVESVIDVVTGEKIPVVDGRFEVSLEPLQTRVFLTPRGRIAAAPSEWFSLQRDWWRAPAAASFPERTEAAWSNTLDLGTDWRFKALAADEAVEPLAAAGVDDSAWARTSLGTWGVGERPVAPRAILRKTFTVPTEWIHGDPSLWVHSWYGATFNDRGRVWLDGKPLTALGANGLADANPDGVLKPGSTHTLAVEIEGSGRLVGALGSAWLWFWPEPKTRIDLAGAWIPSRDALNYSATAVTLPGAFDAMSLRRSADVPADLAGNRAVVRVDSTGGLTGVIVNGKWVRRFHHRIGNRFDLDVTPWVKFGETNEIEIVNISGPASGRLRSVSLDFHAPDSNYP